MVNSKGVQSHMMKAIDILLKRNPYIKVLSDADRIDIYNEALKRIAKLRKYEYTNQSDLETLVINTQYMNLSAIRTINNILDDDIKSFSDDERMLLYNIVQDRIATLRVLQHTHNYLITNVLNVIDSTIILKMPIASMIYNPFTAVKDIFQTILQLSITNKIFNYVTETFQTVLQLSISNRIFNYITQSYQVIKKLPITFTISDVSLIDYIKTKLLTLNLSFTIESGEIPYVVNKVLPLTFTIEPIGEYQYSEQKNLILPLSFTIQ